HVDLFECAPPVCHTDDAAQAVAMYSRSAFDSDAISASRCLTTSPIETIPASLPSSITGTCRNFPVVIRSMRSYRCTCTLRPHASSPFQLIRRKADKRLQFGCCARVFAQHLVPTECLPCTRRCRRSPRPRSDARPRFLQHQTASLWARSLQRHCL